MQFLIYNLFIYFMFFNIASAQSNSEVNKDSKTEVKVETQIDKKNEEINAAKSEEAKIQNQIISAKDPKEIEKILREYAKKTEKRIKAAYKTGQTKATPVAATPVAATPVAATPVAATPVAAASPFRFGGFADLRYTNFSTKDNPLVLSGNPESGFGIEDGAFYGNYDKDNLSVVLDVAFRRSKDVDINSAATKPNQSSNGNLAIGYDKSQLYLKYKLGSMFTINFGQFDTIYGVELNDSKDRIFGKTGIVYDNTLPVTHTGVMFEFLVNGFYAKTFAANPNNKGSNGSSASGDDKSEYGVALGYSNEFIRGQLGYMARPITKAIGTESGNRSLLDAIIGTTLGSFSLDLEYSRVSDPSKNTLTSGDTSDSESAGQGILALASYKFSDAFVVGLRYENIQDDPAALSVKSIHSFGGSIHYRLGTDLELRTEYITSDSKGVNDATWKDSRFNVATLLMF